MTYFDAIVGALATWRVSHMLLYEEGPWSIFLQMRKRLGVQYAEDDTTVISYRYTITVCLWCLSIWIATGVTILQRMSPLARWLLTPFAYGMVASSLDRLFTTAVRNTPSVPDVASKED